MPLSRRDFVAATVAASAAAQQSAIPVIDTHIHLFDPTRPEGVPWPPKSDAVLYRPALPPRYRALTAPFNIRGAIEVECSNWLEDNQWVLDIAAKDPLLVGSIGNLEPGKPDFRKHLDRFHRNPLFRGVRYGNLWGRDLRAELANPAFVADLQYLANTGLVLDTANPDAALMEAVVRLTDKVATLRVVVDHLPQMDTARDPSVRELGKRPQVFVKVSQVLRRVDGRVPVDPAFYRDRIDHLWDTFGEDRLLYGSDWPNSDQWAPYDKVFAVVHDYFLAKGRPVAEKYFWKNSVTAYRWNPRSPAQPR